MPTNTTKLTNVQIEKRRQANNDMLAEHPIVPPCIAMHKNVSRSWSTQIRSDI